MRLPEACTVEHIESLYKTMKEQLGDTTLVLEGADVEKIDISFVQLLLALKNEQQTFKLANPSEKLREQLEQYQLGNLIEAQDS